MVNVETRNWERSGLGTSWKRGGENVRAGEPRGASLARAGLLLTSSHTLAEELLAIDGAGGWGWGERKESFLWMGLQVGCSKK